MSSFPTPQLRKSVVAAAPGLLHFGARPLSLAPMFLTDKLRIYIPGQEILNLEGVTITGPQPARLEKAKATLSSMHESSSQAKALLDGKPIHTELQPFPFWEIAFDAPQDVNEIEVGNRLGRWCGRSYGLCVDLYSPAGAVWRFDNASPHTVLMRMGQLEGACRALTVALAAQPGQLAATAEPQRIGILRALGPVMDTLDRILGGTAVPPDEARALRKKLMLAIMSTTEKLPAQGAASIVHLAARALDFLLERSDRPRNAEPTAIEAEALGVVFAARFLEKRAVELALVQESEVLLHSSEATRTVEERVNTLYQAAGGDAAALPIMFRAHGMSGAELTLNAPDYVASMKEMETLFAELGYECAICYGTFLGAVRTGRFIPHDDDVDMVIVLKNGASVPLGQELSGIVDALTAKGVNARIAEGHDFLKIRAPKAGKFVDVFPIVIKDDATVRMHMEQLTMRDVARSLVLPFGRMNFYGATFKRPATDEGFLADRYGSDWRTPKRLIGASMLDV